MSEVDFRFITRFRNFKNDFCALPLAVVFSEVEEVVQNKSDELLAGNLNQLHFAVMDVLVTISELIAESYPCNGM